MTTKTQIATVLPERPKLTISGDGVVTATASDVINTTTAQTQIAALRTLIKRGHFSGHSRQSDTDTEE